MLNLIADREFYETFDKYQPNEDDYISIVKNLLPPDWTYNRNGTWLGCRPPETEATVFVSQGWKIHVSSNVGNAVEILKAVVPVLKEDSTGFKFALDRSILVMMNGKAYGRQGAGKFITIYPTDEEHFKALIEKVHQVTRDFQGLYILSDKRYRDSNVVFYRYGGIMPISELDITGRKRSFLIAPGGEVVEDVRRPYFHVPQWTKDPFEEPAAEKVEAEKVEAESITLKDGRYVVKYPLGYSNSGGVYIAEDTTTGNDVVIKEARPFISTTENSLELLEKEHRILAKLGATGFVPKVIDFFQDWEHLFLVMERVEGGSLTSFAAGGNITLKTTPTKEDARKSYENFRTIFLQLAHILKTLHENKIIFTDFSPNNVIVNSATMEVKLIDFEGAYEINIDTPVPLFTPGFVAPAQMSGQSSSAESDFFALGATMHYYLAPVNQIFAIHPKARYGFVKSVIEDIGFPKVLYTLISKLIDKSAAKRPSADKVIQTLEKKSRLRSPEFRAEKADIDAECEKLAESIPEYILAKADYTRNERLFPADASIFGTNPLSLAHGACGVAYAINKMTGGVPATVKNWILERNKNPELYPPGLYMGLAGIAWGMLEIGLTDDAEKVLQSSFDHRLLHESANLYYGISGWGLANLKFFARLQDERYLEKAIEAGDFLVKTLSKDEKGYHTTTENGIPLGFQFGSSGISVFLLYLYLATRNQTYFEVGSKALDFDINNASPNIEGGISWKRYVDQGRIVYPYFGQGSAGVGAAAVKYYRLTGDEKYRALLEQIYDDTNRKYAVFPGVISGLSGMGELHLDLYNLTNDSRYLDAAYRIASGLLLFKIEKEEGTAFPGDELRRISCDYATGSAGIGLFLHRLATRGEGNFHVDELFAEKQQSVTG